MKISKKISFLLLLIGISCLNLNAMRRTGGKKKSPAKAMTISVNIPVGYSKQPSNGYCYYRDNIDSRPRRISEAVYLRAMTFQQQNSQTEVLAPEDINALLETETITSSDSDLKTGKRLRPPSPTHNNNDTSSSIPSSAPTKKLKPNDSSIIDLTQQDQLGQQQATTAVSNSSSSSSSTPSASTPASSSSSSSSTVTTAAPQANPQTQSLWGYTLRLINSVLRNPTTASNSSSSSSNSSTQTPVTVSSGSSSSAATTVAPQTPVQIQASAQTSFSTRTTSSTLDPIEQAKEASLKTLREENPQLFRFLTIIENSQQYKNLKTAQNKIDYCDRDTITVATFNEPVYKHYSIYQLPCLCQVYPCLEAIYAQGFDLLCGHYALHFAKILAQNPQATLDQLLPPLNNRTSFNNDTLSPNKTTCLNNHLNPTFISSETIQLLLNQHIKQYTYVQDAITYDLIQNMATINLDEIREVAPDISQEIERINTLITAFKENKIPYIIFILNPGLKSGTHWFTVFARRNAQQHVELIICDSRELNHCNDQAIIALYEQLTGGQGLTTSSSSTASTTH